jgi:hypothetical protein
VPLLPAEAATLYSTPIFTMLACEPLILLLITDDVLLYLRRPTMDELILAFIPPHYVLTYALNYLSGLEVTLSPHQPPVPPHVPPLELSQLSSPLLLMSHSQSLEVSFLP